MILSTIEKCIIKGDLDSVLRWINDLGEIDLQHRITLENLTVKYNQIGIINELIKRKIYDGSLVGYEAGSQGNLEVLKHLVKSPANNDVYWGEAAFSAAENGYVDCVIYLIKYILDRYGVFYHLLELTTVAAEHGQFNVVKAVAEKIPHKWGIQEWFDIIVESGRKESVTVVEFKSVLSLCKCNYDKVLGEVVDSIISKGGSKAVLFWVIGEMVSKKSYYQEVVYKAMKKGDIEILNELHSTGYINGCWELDYDEIREECEDEYEKFPETYHDYLVYKNRYAENSVSAKWIENLNK